MQTEPRDKLPGEIENGKFKCHLCEQMKGIFEVEFVSCKWRVCHKCEIELTVKACKETDYLRKVHQEG